MIRLLVALFALSLLATTAHAQVYRWVDDKGEVHYTDNPESIPAAKRKAAVKTDGVELGFIGGGKAPAPKDAPKAPNTAEEGDGNAEADAAARAREDDDARERAAEEEEARREKDWRGRFRDAHSRIERLERMLAADKKALADPANSGIPMMRPNHNGVILPNPEFEAIKQRIPEQEAQLAEAREDLADLEREASRNSVPQHWRK